MAVHWISSLNSAGFPLWILCSFALHVGLINMRTGERVDKAAPSRGPMTFELLEVQTQVPASIAVTSGRVTPTVSGVPSVRVAAQPRTKQIPLPKSASASPVPAELPGTSTAAEPSPTLNQPLEHESETKPSSAASVLHSSPEVAQTGSASFRTPGTGTSRLRDEYSPGCAARAPARHHYLTCYCITRGTIARSEGDQVFR
jgi:hypothetical protein